MFVVRKYFNDLYEQQDIVSEIVPVQENPGMCHQHAVEVPKRLKQNKN